MAAIEAGDELVDVGLKVPGQQAVVDPEHLGGGVSEPIRSFRHL